MSLPRGENLLLDTHPTPSPNLKKPWYPCHRDEGLTANRVAASKPYFSRRSIGWTILQDLLAHQAEPHRLHLLPLLLRDDFRPSRSTFVSIFSASPSATLSPLRIWKPTYGCCRKACTSDLLNASLMSSSSQGVKCSQRYRAITCMHAQTIPACLVQQ